MNGEVLEQIYQERLEERIISYLAETEEMSLETAMDIYYNSKLAGKSHEGRYGVQYLDYKVLVQILCETEADLVQNAKGLQGTGHLFECVTEREVAKLTRFESGLERYGKHLMVMGYCVSAETIMGIGQIGQGNRKEIDAFITSQWFFTQTVLHGECVDLGAADGWYVL